MKKFMVLSRGEVSGDYRQYILVDGNGSAFHVLRCNWGKWPEFQKGEEVAVMQLNDRLSWEAAGFDPERVHEIPMMAANNLAEIAELRSQSNNVCSA